MSSHSETITKIITANKSHLTCDFNQIIDQHLDSIKLQLTELVESKVDTSIKNFYGHSDVKIDEMTFDKTIGTVQPPNMTPGRKEDGIDDYLIQCLFISQAGAYPHTEKLLKEYKEKIAKYSFEFPMKAIILYERCGRGGENGYQKVFITKRFIYVSRTAMSSRGDNPYIPYRFYDVSLPSHIIFMISQLFATDFKEISYNSSDMSHLNQTVKNIENIINLYQTTPQLFYPNSLELEKTMKDEYDSLREKQEYLDDSIVKFEKKKEMLEVQVGDYETYLRDKILLEEETKKLRQMKIKILNAKKELQIEREEFEKEKNSFEDELSLLDDESF